MAKAVWFTGPRRAELIEEEVGPPAAGEIQVAARYSLISPGTELTLYRGEADLPHLVIPTADGQLPFPVKFAYQTIGEVVEAGAGSAWKPGDLVFCTHPHQERFNIVPEIGMVSRIPDGSNLRSAIFGTMFTTALGGHLDAPVRPGDCVAVAGLGLIGMFSAYLARLSAARLVLIDPIEQRREKAGWIGADAVVEPSQAVAKVEELTDGRGADLFIEASGAPASLQTGLEATGEDGVIDAVAWYGTRPVELLLSREFHLRCHDLRSSHIAAIARGKYHGWDPERAFQTSVEYLSRIDESQLISHEFPFAEARGAYELIDANPADTLGVLLVHEQY
ncbi:MAG TPA: zinc-binding alcohol dehydrogenase [Solirubrobacterales bacterium]|jgi:2-desacetyl-2-hydroxyethyl bacteriochlorophyllide A dehydrogenase